MIQRLVIFSVNACVLYGFQSGLRAKESVMLVKWHLCIASFVFILSIYTDKAQILTVSQVVHGRMSFVNACLVISTLW